MVNLSDRQKQLLKAIIEIYVKGGEPVSSDLIEKSYDLGVSPATIRNEMVRLTDSGFLKQPHVSAGRIPTSMGFRLYISELMKTRDIPVVDEVAMRQQVLEKRAQFDHMVQEATRALARKLNMLALCINDGDVYYTGASHMLDLPEFYDIDVTRFVLSLFDEPLILQKIFDKAHGEETVHVIFGEETGFEHLLPTSFAFLDFDTIRGNRGVLGVVGPNRLNFPVVIPYLTYMGEVLSEAAKF